MNVTIYVLVDPRDGEVRYVGQTKRTLGRRLGGHIAVSKRLRTHRDCWIAGMMACGVRPEITEIETCGEDWPERERFWIAHFRSAGVDLTNRTEGGEGTSGVSQSEENRRASAARQSALMQDPERRALLSERVAASWTPDRRKAKAVETALRMTPEVRAAKSELQQSPEMLARHREKQAAYWTPERRAARAAQVKAAMTPERIAAHAAKLREKTASPEWRAAHSQRERAKWTPEMRAAQAERTRRQLAEQRGQQA